MPKSYKYAFLAGFLVILILFIGSLLVNKPFAGAGYIIFDSVPEKSSIYVDNKPFYISLGKQEKVSAGEHSIIVHTPGFFPWGKTIYLKKDSEVILKPFLMPENPQTTLIQEFLDDGEGPNKVNEEYFKVKNSFKEKVILTQLSESQDSTLYIDGNTLRVKWNKTDILPPQYFCDDTTCKTEVLVFKSEKDIKNATFYPKNESLILFNTDTGIYVIEIDKRGMQNFQPIYEGNNIDFTIYSNRVFIFDKDKLSELLLP